MVKDEPVCSSHWFEHVLMQYRHDRWQRLMRISRDMFDVLLANIEAKLQSPKRKSKLNTGGRPVKAAPALQVSKTAGTVAVAHHSVAAGPVHSLLRPWIGICIIRGAFWGGKVNGMSLHVPGGGRHQYCSFLGGSTASRLAVWRSRAAA